MFHLECQHLFIHLFRFFFFFLNGLHPFSDSENEMGHFLLLGTYSMTSFLE